MCYPVIERVLLLQNVFSENQVLLMPAPVSGSRPGLNISTMFTVAAIYISASNKLPDTGQW